MNTFVIELRRWKQACLEACRANTEDVFLPEKKVCLVDTYSPALISYLITDIIL